METTKPMMMPLYTTEQRRLLLRYLAVQGEDDVRHDEAAKEAYGDKLSACLRRHRGQMAADADFFTRTNYGFGLELLRRPDLGGAVPLPLSLNVVVPSIESKQEALIAVDAVARMFGCAYLFTDGPKQEAVYMRDLGKAVDLKVWVEGPDSMPLVQRARSQIASHRPATVTDRPGLRVVLCGALADDAATFLSEAFERVRALDDDRARRAFLLGFRHEARTWAPTDQMWYWRTHPLFDDRDVVGRLYVVSRYSVHLDGRRWSVTDDWRSLDFEVLDDWRAELAAGEDDAVEDGRRMIRELAMMRRR